MQKISFFFSKEYLFATIQNSRFENLYLYLSLLLIVAPIILKIALAIWFKGRPKKIYKTFDSIWFWGFWTLGILGLFVWFSRTQLLPIFSTRFVSYLWLLLISVMAIWLFIYYKKRIPNLSEKYYKAARKKRYLK